MGLKTVLRRCVVVSAPLLLMGCLVATTHDGMVKNGKTGLMFGSKIGGSFTTDPAFYPNRKIKVRVRNTSGDPQFNLKQFKHRLEAAYRALGYKPTEAGDFGLLMDINVRYSGQVQTNMQTKFSVFGGAAGGAIGFSKDLKGQTTVGRSMGAISGAAIGDIIGSFITDDTYVVITSVTFGVRKYKGTSGKTITFNRSMTKSERDFETEMGIWRDGFRNTMTTEIAAYAGGRNVGQGEIAEQVRQRLARILGNLI